MMVLLIFLTAWSAPAAEDARVLSERCSVTVQPDGRAVTECRVEEEVRTQLAMDVFLDPRFRWRPDKQKFTVLEAYSIAPRTKRRMDTPPHAINVVTPFSEETVPGSTFWRETVVSFVGVEPGSKLVRKTRLEDTVPPETPYEAVFPLQRVRPVDFLELRFSGVASVQLVDPPAGCKLEGRPPAFTITCRSVPGAGFAGIGTGRKTEITPDVMGRLPRAVVSAWKDGAALREVLQRRRRAYTPECRFPAFLEQEMQTQLTPAGRLEVLRRTWNEALRTLPVPRAPVDADTFWRYRAGTQEERALAFAAALGRFVPEAQNVRVIHASLHEAAAAGIPNLQEFPRMAVTFVLQGRALAWAPDSGEVGPPESVAGGAWWLEAESKEVRLIEAAGPLRALTARMRISPNRIAVEGQVLWETFGDAPDCARMVPPIWGKVEICTVEESAPGWRRVRFTAFPEQAVFPGILPKEKNLSDWEAGASVVLAPVRTRMDLDVSLEAGVQARVLKIGTLQLNLRSQPSGSAGAGTAQCHQEITWNTRGFRIRGNCETNQRHHYGARVKPAEGIGFAGNTPLTIPPSRAVFLAGRRDWLRLVSPPELWFSLRETER